MVSKEIYEIGRRFSDQGELTAKGGNMLKIGATHTPVKLKVGYEYALAVQAQTRKGVRFIKLAAQLFFWPPCMVAKGIFNGTKTCHYKLTDPVDLPGYLNPRKSFLWQPGFSRTGSISG